MRLIEEELVFAGASCVAVKDKSCKVWWLSTIRNKTHQAEVKIPHYSLVSTISPKHAEIRLENIFKDSKLKVSIPVED